MTPWTHPIPPSDTAAAAPPVARGSTAALRDDRRAYRADLDGLRALAVGAVVAFHAFPSGARGGFVGVDVFFVLSGFLITSRMLADLQARSFSLWRFYARRARRLFPALALAMAACWAFGWFALLPDEYRQLGRHIAAGAGFVANLVLASESSYFDNAADTKPLLHLWSLGIEEQFYLAWPLVVLLAWRLRLLLPATLALLLGSFALNLDGVRHAADAAFYAPHARAWELLVGALLALVRGGARARGFDAPAARSLVRPLAPRLARLSEADHRALANLAAWAGVALLAEGLLRIGRHLPYPGTWALYPVAGTALLIAAGPGAWLNRRLLAQPLVAGLGRISYPLYLWHWPMLSFATIVLGEVPSEAVRLALVAVAVAAAWLTWRLVEIPVQRAAAGPAAPVGLLAVLAVLGALGWLTFTGDGWPRHRLSPLRTWYAGDIGQLAFHRSLQQRFSPCRSVALATGAPVWEGMRRCLQSRPAPDPSVALIGDSHAEHLFPGVAEALPHRTVVYLVRSGLPFPDNPDFRGLYEGVVRDPSITHVILSLYWIDKMTWVASPAAMEAGLLQAIDLLSGAGKTVFLTDDVPTFPFLPATCQGRRWPLADAAPVCEMPVATAEAQRAIYRPTLQAVLARRPAVRLLPVGDTLCDATTCGMTDGRSVLYRDKNHLNLVGASTVGRRMIEQHAAWFE